MIYRVSMVEAFRKWEGDDEAELADIVSIIRGEWPESDAMRAGTAFHKAIETLAGDDSETLEADGHTFFFDEDFEVELTPIREVRASKTYIVDGAPIVISGQADGVSGNRVDDTKTTGFFDPDRYISGYQWRLYLDIFGADRFRWNVFEIREESSTQHIKNYTVRAMHRLEQHRYPELADDCQALVERFARFVRGMDS